MIKKVFAALALVSIATFANASCDQFYPNGQAIKIVNARELCNSFFVTQYDDQLKRNLFSSELLQPQGHAVERKNDFHADSRSINPVKPSEYHDSGFDKGHMVPAGDSTSDTEMFDTFLMTNMTPQNGPLNRGPWKLLEEQTRKEVSQSGKPAIVLTGALYESTDKMGRVPVPTGYYKILYLSGGQPVAYYADNNVASKPHPVQMSWITAKTGINFPK